MRIIQTLLFVTLTSLSFSASSISEKNESFASFIWRFFKYSDFQINRIEFPVEILRFVDELKSLRPVLGKEQINKNEWKHILGPKHFGCQRNCFDINVYDNFEKKLNNTGKRVLSLEGVENGINSSYYFKLKENKWYLVKIEWLST